MTAVSAPHAPAGGARMDDQGTLTSRSGATASMEPPHNPLVLSLTCLSRKLVLSAMTAPLAGHCNERTRSDDSCSELRVSPR